MPNSFFKRIQPGGIQDLHNKSKNFARKVNYNKDSAQPNQPEPVAFNSEPMSQMPENNTPQMPQEQEEMMDTEIEELDDYSSPEPPQNPATLAAMTMAKRSTKKSSRSSTSEEGQLTVDVYETPKAIVIKSVVAGVSTNDLKITITPEHVSISGERRHEESVDNDAYFYQECFWGSFSRSISLPTEIDPEDAKASISKGVLMIVLPKLERKGEKTLQIEEV